MNVWTSIRRALMLALLLPALLVPSGWSLRVCFCAAMEAQAEAGSCCSARAAASCCDEETPAPQAGHHKTCDACREFGADNRRLPPSLAAAPDVPLAAPCAVPVWTPVVAPLVATLEPLVLAHPAAPPDPLRSLPLRI